MYNVAQMSRTQKAALINITKHALAKWGGLTPKVHFPLMTICMPISSAPNRYGMSSFTPPSCYASSEKGSNIAINCSIHLCICTHMHMYTHACIYVSDSFWLINHDYILDIRHASALVDLVINDLELFWGSKCNLDFLFCMIIHELIKSCRAYILDMCT